jgi:hypothetical protein
MKIILLINKIKPKRMILGDKIGSLLKAKATLRSFESRVVDLIPLNQRGLCGCTRSERID